MKKIFLYILAGSLALYGCQSSTAESQTEEESVVKNGIRWRGDNETANYLSIQGIGHWSNIEFAQAYTVWNHAVELDPTLFAPHVMLSMMSVGEAKEYHKSMAKEHVANENETGKTFVSLLDAENGEERRAIWAKMRELSNGPFIQHMYARSLSNQDDQSAALEELDKVILFCEENGRNSSLAASYNIKAYLSQQSGDMTSANVAVDKYVEIWDGPNSADSRAEMYLLAGDTTNAILWYKKALERYPYATSARQQLNILDPKVEEEENSDSESTD